MGEGTRRDKPSAANRQEIEWWKKLTPLQRVIIAVLRGAMIEKARQDDQKRAYEEAIYGRP